MDAHARLHPQHGPLALLSLFNPRARQPPRAVLPDHVARLRAHDDENHPRALDAPALPLLDRATSAAHGWSALGKLAAVGPAGRACDDGAVVSEGVFRVCGGGVWAVGGTGC